MLAYYIYYTTYQLHDYDDLDVYTHAFVCINNGFTDIRLARLHDQHS